MASGAGALNLSLGGTAFYAGNQITKPILGLGDPPTSSDIAHSFALLKHSLTLFMGLQLVIYLLMVVIFRVLENV